MKLQLEKKELVQLSDDPQVLPLAMTDEVAGGKHKIPSQMLSVDCQTTFDCQCDDR